MLVGTYLLFMNSNHFLLCVIDFCYKSLKYIILTYLPILHDFYHELNMQIGS